jgi:WD40 repeat protein
MLILESLVPAGSTALAEVIPVESRPSREFVGHTDRINCIAFSPDGRRLASGSDDGTLRVWDVQTGREIWKYDNEHSYNHFVKETMFGPKHETRTKSMAVERIVYSPNSRRIAKFGGPTQIFDARSGELRTDFPGHGGSTGSFSPDGKLIVFGTHKGATLCNAVTGELVESLGYPYGCVGKGGGTGARFGPDNNTAILQGEGGMEVRDIPSGSPRFPIESRGNHPSMALSDDRSRLAVKRDKSSSPMNSEVRVWEISSGSEIFTLTPSYKIHGIGLSPHGDLLGVSGYFGDEVWEVRVWDIQSKTQIARFRPAPVSSLRFSPNRNYLAVASSNKIAQLWDVDAGKLVAEFPLVPNRDSWIPALLEFSPNGTLIVAAGAKHTIQVWNVDELIRDQSMDDNRETQPWRRLSPSAAGMDRPTRRSGH